MKIKSIDQFTINDCENYLAQNPNGDNADDVRTRLHYLQQQEIERNRQKKEKLYHVNWIDIREFLGTTKYKVANKFIIISNWVCILGAILCVFLISASLYYFNTRQGGVFYYPEDNYGHGEIRLPIHKGMSMHESMLNDLELFLIEIECFEEPYIEEKSPLSRYDYDDYDDYLDANKNYWNSKSLTLRGSSYNYRLSDGLLGLGFISVILLLIAFFINLLTSPILSKIHIIERPISKSKKQVLRVQGNNGKMGLCYCGIFRVKRLLPFEFDKIYPCGNNAFICELSDQKGVYNTDKRQMVIPMRRQDIEVCQNNDNTVLVITNGQSEKFTTNGYRVIN